MTNSFKHINAEPKFFELVERELIYHFKPGFIDRFEKAKEKGWEEVDKIRMEALEAFRNEIENSDISDDDKKALLYFTIGKRGYQIIFEFENTSKVLDFAYNQLSGKKASDDPVDSNWSRTFFRCIKNIIDLRRQQIWGKILSDEIQNPGTYHIDTLVNLFKFAQKNDELFFKNYYNQN